MPPAEIIAVAVFPEPIELMRNSNRIIIEGDVPSPINPPSGCTFRTRCQYVKDICSQVIPELVEIETEHFVACHKVNDPNF